MDKAKGEDILTTLVRIWCEENGQMLKSITFSEREKDEKISA